VSALVLGGGGDSYCVSTQPCCSHLSAGRSILRTNSRSTYLFRKSDGFRGTAVQANRLLDRECLCLLSADSGDARKLILSGEHNLCRSLWPNGLRRGSAAARLLGLRFRIPPEAWMSVSCECCALSSSLYVQRSFTKSAVCKCGREASIMMRLSPTRGCCI
jgi:hypothetical protein